MNIKSIILLVALLVLTVNSQTGVYKSYHINGKKSAEISYSDGIYDGTSYWYYPNGNLQEEKTYSNGKMNGWYRAYYESGLLKEEKYVNEGINDGIRKIYYANGALKSIMNYENGIQVKVTEFDYDPFYKAPIEAYRAGNKQQTEEKKSDEYLCDVKICPEPLGGMESIYDKLVYPADAVAYGLEGVVKLLATINKDGNVIETKLIRGIGLGCDEAAAEAVKQTRFLPGQNESGPTTSNVTLNINFILKEGKPVFQSKPSSTYSTEKVDEPEIGVASTPTVTNTTEQTDNQESVQKVETVKSDKPESNYTAKPPTIYFKCDNVDICAQPEDGINAVLRNLKIPNRVKEQNIQGNVVVLCDVDETGKVRKTTVQQGLPEGAGIAVEVALLDTKFNPAKKDGKPIASEVIVTVPIKP